MRTETKVTMLMEDARGLLATFEREWPEDNRPRRCVECAESVMANRLNPETVESVADAGQRAADACWSGRADAWWAAEAAHLALRTAVAFRTDDPEFLGLLRVARDAVLGANSRSDTATTPVRMETPVERAKKRVRCNPGARDRVVSLWNQGKTKREIAMKVGLSTRSVGQIVSRI